MASISINKCDKCGVEVRSDTNQKAYDSFMSIKIELSKINNFSSVVSYLYLCQTCCGNLGIIEKPSTGYSSEQYKSNADKLYDIFRDIIQEMNQCPVQD